MMIGWINQLDRPEFTLSGDVYFTPELPLQNAAVDPLGKVARSIRGFTVINIDFQLSGAEIRVIGFLNTTLAVHTLNHVLTMSAVSQAGSDFYSSGVKNFTTLGMKVGYLQSYFVIPPLGEGALFARLSMQIPSTEVLDIGRIVIYGGANDGFWEPPRNYAHGAAIQWIDESAHLQTLGGQDVARGGPRRRRFDIDLPNNARGDMLNHIFELDRIAGLNGNVLVMLDPVNQPVVQSIWGRLEVATPLIESRGRMGKRFIIKERL